MIEMPLLLVAEVRRLRGTLPCQLEGEAQHAVDAHAGHHRLLDDDLAVGALEHPAADARVLALGVLAHDAEVDVARGASGERAAYARHQPGRAEVHVLVERAPKLQQAPPQRHVVGHDLRPADRAEEDRVEATQRLEPVVGQHRARPLVVVRAGEVERRSNSRPMSNASAAARSARRPSGTTSWPIPSPGMTAILCMIGRRYAKTPKAPRAGAFRSALSGRLPGGGMWARRYGRARCRVGADRQPRTRCLGRSRH